jgi:hypothetical protein
MGTVYLAHDVRHERDVAIKVLNRDLADVVGADRLHRRNSHHGPSPAPSHPAAVRLGYRRRPAVLRNGQADVWKMPLAGGTPEQVTGSETSS